MELEKIALSDEYFIKRSLYPNVDFYSGTYLRCESVTEWGLRETDMRKEEGRQNKSEGMGRWG
jgi:hypothetical protein